MIDKLAGERIDEYANQRKTEAQLHGSISLSARAGTSLRAESVVEAVLKS